MLASRGKVAIPIAMSVPGQMPLAEAKNRLSEVVDRLEREHGHVIITKHRQPAAVVISVEAVARTARGEQVGHRGGAAGPRAHRRHRPRDDDRGAGR
jgi:prevent-host-death family protein